MHPVVFTWSSPAAPQARACQAVAALSGTLEHLHLTTGVDASWLPHLPYLTRLELCFARRRRPHRFAEGEGDAAQAGLAVRPSGGAMRRQARP